jgi:MFS transporter, DHA1 family, multidrug resistance protein
LLPDTIARRWLTRGARAAPLPTGWYSSGVRIERSYVVVAASTAAEGLVSFLVPPYLDSVHFPVGIIGILVATGALASLASRVPAGLLYRGRRARALLVGSMALGAVATLLLPYAHEPLAFAALRALGGFSYGVATTVNLARFIDAIPTNRDRATAMGYFSAALAVGFMIGNGLGGFSGELLGYPIAFTLAAANYVIGAIVAMTLPPPRTGGARPRPAPPPAAGRWARLRVLGEPGVLRVTLAAFLLAFMQSISGAFMPLYGLSVGLALSEVGVIRTMTALANAITRGLGGYVTRQLGRARVMHVGLALQAVGLMLIASFDVFWALFVVMFWVATCRAIVLVANTIALTEDIDETRVSRGVASGLFNAASDLGQVIAPALGGLVATLFGLGTMFHVLPPLVLLLYFAAMLATARQRVPGKAEAR